jgi:hypothetical protein
MTSQEDRTDANRAHHPHNPHNHLVASTPAYLVE